MREMNRASTNAYGTPNKAVNPACQTLRFAPVFSAGYSRHYLLRRNEPPGRKRTGYLSKDVFVLNAASDGEYNPIRIKGLAQCYLTA